MSTLPTVRRGLTADRRGLTADRRGLAADRPLNRIADIEAISRPARTFTGDFYFTHHTNDRVWLALGDVAGKGLPAAIVMAMIQEELEHLIASCAATACDPARTMARLHDFLLPLMPQNRFATAVMGTLSEDGTLTIVNGGHCPPLILRRDGSIEEIGSTGPILGILRIAKWRTFTTRLEEGDTLVLYSDGVTESERNGEELGVCGLRKLIGEVGSSPAALLRELREVGDDVTLVTVRR
ncbi:MAG TPA: PP2C family protein-serine/threonine phosphatase [Thermoanaerobaculia bacterium]|nr:PP2C family protein-serine/threonine phosphatase [Thermoanaerobaculia bacterium]